MLFPAKNEALLFQSTVDIHFQNAHKTQKLRELALSKISNLEVKDESELWWAQVSLERASWSGALQ